ncbi:MAG: hypothetical protein HYS13_12710 [Planctomycetia bacterium]|nr:hypothetical protein [Planctomycetia bacterium]
MPLSFLIDEDTRDERIWRAIEQHNLQHPSEAIDVIRVGDAGAPPFGMKDPDLVMWSIAANRIILSHDKNTLIRWHDEIVRSGSPTPGLIIVRRGVTIPEFVDWLALIAHLCEREEFESQCRFLP